MKDVPAELQTSESDSFTEQLLGYFKISKSPNYAVFINGGWGVGKTFYIKNTFPNLKKRFLKKDRKEQFYISLFGVESSKELEQRIYDKFFSRWQVFLILVGVIVFLLFCPFLWGSEKWTNLLLPIGSTIIAISCILMQLFKTFFLRICMINRYIVFDDLERVAPSCSSHEVLAFINDLIEHQGMHIIVIGNEKEIHDQDEFQKEKEKCVAFEFAFDRSEQLTIDSILRSKGVVLSKDIQKKFLEVMNNFFKKYYNLFLSYKTVKGVKASPFLRVNFRSFSRTIDKLQKIKSFQPGIEQEKDFVIPFLFYSQLEDCNICHVHELAENVEFDYIAQILDQKKKSPESFIQEKAQIVFRDMNQFLFGTDSLWVNIFDDFINSKQHIENLLKKIKNIDVPLEERIKKISFLTDDAAKNTINEVLSIIDEHRLHEYMQILNFYQAAHSLAILRMLPYSENDLIRVMKEYVDYLYEHDLLIYERIQPPHYFDALHENEDPFVIYLKEKVESLIPRNKVAMQTELIDTLGDNPLAFCKKMQKLNGYNAVFVDDDDKYVQKMVDGLKKAQIAPDNELTLEKTFNERYPNHVWDRPDLASEHPFFIKVQQSLKVYFDEHKLSRTASEVRLLLFFEHNIKNAVKNTDPEALRKSKTSE